MIKVTKYRQRILIAALLAFVITFLLLLYIFRSRIIMAYLLPRVERVEAQYDLKIHYDELDIKGLHELELKGLSVTPVGCDTLLRLNYLDVHIGFWSLLGAHIDVTELQTEGLNLTFRKKNGHSNYGFLFRESNAGDNKRTAKESEGRNFSRVANELLDLAFDVLPTEGRFLESHISEQNDSNAVSLSIPELELKDHQIQTDLTFCEDDFCQKIDLKGVINPSKRDLSVTISSPHLIMPYIQRRFGIYAAMNRLDLSLTQTHDSNDDVRINGHVGVNGLHTFQPRLSADTIVLDHCTLDYYANVTPKALELDSLSEVAVNKFAFHPFIRLEEVKDTLNEPQWHFTFSVHKHWFPANELFSSLPKGLFSNLQGLKCTGKLHYKLLLDVDFRQLDSLIFDSEMASQNFRITSYGSTRLDKMNEEFEYTAYENGLPVRTFPIGHSWNHYTPLDSIPAKLQMCILSSEDGGFFHHQGFLPDAMRSALAYDLKEHRFARGGSTITMQIVKNVFLNRNKNIMRKVEEAMIVWLIEHQHITSKERMWEVYVNIIEWGPLIYGIHEAADFYFHKLPSQLSTEECIYLASIIPKPKHFRGCFEPDGHLKENQSGFFRLLGERFVTKGFMSEGEAATIDYRKVVIDPSLLNIPQQEAEPSPEVLTENEQ